MTDTEEKLLENHLAFLASHRGRIRRQGTLIFVESERREFTYTLLGRGARMEHLPETGLVVQHFHWTEIQAEELCRQGFAFTQGLSYMTLQGELPASPVHSELIVKRVNTQVAMDDFSQVQSRGFNETQETHEYWYPWLKAANDKNLLNPNQIFYVGYLKGEPVSTVLAVFEGDTAGIYAVATLPQYRKKGVSTTLMQEALKDARKRGTKMTTLQVRQDSYAEDFYRHLGFQLAFTTGLYTRTAQPLSESLYE
ncbi:MAG: GNAT family N-acetyltransferase [Bdellovibrionales bacterium]